MSDIRFVFGAQPFDLAIRPGEGNCVDCFEAAAAKPARRKRAA